METSTAVLLPPDDRDDRAPPTACRIRENMSQGYSGILVISIAYLGIRIGTLIPVREPNSTPIHVSWLRVQV